VTWDDFYRVALSSGLLPEQFWDMTFREVSYFTSSVLENEKLEWRRHSYLLSILANQNRGKGKPAIKPDDFYPFEVERQEVTKDDIDAVVDHLKNRRQRKPNG